MGLRLTDKLYLVGSGIIGLSHPTDPNIYLIDGGGELALVDAGSGICPELIIRNLMQSNFKPEDVRFIINTHSHWDHARGSSFVKKLTGAELVMHELGAQVVERDLWAHSYLASQGVISPPTKVDITLRDDTTLKVGSVELKIYYTPGHTADSICVFMEDEGKKILISGDTVLANGLFGMIGVETDFPKLRDSLFKLVGLECEVLLPGHGLFVLTEGGEHVHHLAKKLNSPWREVVLGSTPFLPSWWLEQRPSLLKDAFRTLDSFSVPY